VKKYLKYLKWPLVARNGMKILCLLKEYYLLGNDFVPRRQFVYYSIGFELYLEKCFVFVANNIILFSLLELIKSLLMDL
jgi:hypothetical protein